jgi:FeS assembly SUF system protein
MDRDREESQGAFEDHGDRHGPFGVRESRPPTGSSVEEAAGPPNRAPDRDAANEQTNAGASHAEKLPGDDCGDNAPKASDGDDASKVQLRERIIDAMKTVYDPEIPVNIYDLGMVYEIEVRPDHSVLVTMTLTSPACPVAGTLPGEVEEKVNEVEGVNGGKVELVWDPPWTPERMSESAKLELGMF